MCDVSIVIVNWNTCSELKACLSSIDASCRNLDYETIVVDNASEDGSVEMIQRDFSRVQLICNHRNEGFAKANNQAFAIAKGRYLLCVNSDVIVLDEAIAKFVVYADQHPEAGVLGCRILNKDYTLQRSCYLYPSALNLLFSCLYADVLFSQSRIFGRECFTWWDFAHEKEVDLVKGCFFMIRQKVIQEIGSFDEHYFMFCEEADLCYRIRKAGYKILYYPEIQVVHIGQVSVRKMPVEMKLILMGSRLFFIKKHYSRFHYITSCFLTSFYFFLRAPVFFFIGVAMKENRKTNLKRARMYYWAVLYSLFNSDRLRTFRKSPDNK